jgi:SAM-dependent methyltransferase
MQPDETPKEHWQRVYATRAPESLSWFQAEPSLSLEWIEAATPDRDAPILDVGGGASTLVDGLLDRGYRDLTVLDLAAPALDAARRRLGARAGRVSWREADLLAEPLAAASVALWHDRAVFHFLVDAADRARYAERAAHAIRPGGHALLATFAADGPRRCSGLEVRGYAAPELALELGTSFELVDERREEHRTPAGAVQRFQYVLLRRKG